MKFIFWLSISWLFYTYFGYPFLMAFLTKIVKSKPINKADIFPDISLVISAYNEEKNIGAKLNDILNLDYPKEKMEVVVISDASSDNTDNIVRGFENKGIKLFRLNERSGKIAAYKRVLPELKGEIIVFSDATSLLEKENIIKLISNFNDERVGCAGGLLAYINPKNALVGKGEKRYWSYEKRVREYESRLCSLTSVSGTLYAVRKNLFPIEIKNDLADDLIVPFNVVKKGFRTVYEKEAVCKDFTTISLSEEIAKRVRITVQNIRGLIDQADIFNPFRFGLFSLLVISHKLLRLMVPIFLISLLLATSFLARYSGAYLTFLVVQALFYIGSVIGYMINKKVKFSLGNALFYFCLSNYAILLGMFNFLKGKRVITWETVRT